jgi:hypothetical protein
MACEDLQKVFDAAEQRSLSLAKQLKDPTLKDPAEKANLQKASQAAGAALFRARQALSDCQLKSGLIPQTPAAPSRILETDYVNPKFSPKDPSTWNQDFRKSVTLPIVGQVTGFPYFGKEWTQVLAPDDEYDSPSTLVAASGWVINPGLAGADFPFDHPFGDKVFEFDYEFQLATDTKYHELLGPGNKGSGDAPVGSDLFNEFTNERQANALKPAPADGTIDTSLGLLGIEWEKHNIPQSFQDNIHHGDRTVVAGRWIVDCGHDIARTEIHPPLLMACASALDSDTTRVLFTSRPYLVGQTFTTDLSSIYVDGQNDDGEFMVHMLKEMVKINDTFFGIPLESRAVEAHPKIKSRPFKGNPRVRFIIRPSSLQTPPATVRTAVVQRRRLAVSFQFTVRSGVSVQITNPEVDRVDVVITMNEAAYRPPPLPNCDHSRAYQKAELTSLDNAAAAAILGGEVVSAVAQFLHSPFPVISLFSAAEVDHFLSNGIKTDHYDPLDNRVNVLDSSQQAVDTFGNPTAGIAHNDNQPFPVFGWIQVKWVVAPLSVQH